jgi:hypothetical protein
MVMSTETRMAIEQSKPMPKSDERCVSACYETSNTMGQQHGVGHEKAEFRVAPFEDALRQKIVGQDEASKQSSNSIRYFVPGCALQGAQSEICYFSGRPAQAKTRIGHDPHIAKPSCTEETA